MPAVDQMQKREQRSWVRGLAEGQMGQGSQSSGGDRGFKKGHSGGDLGGVWLLGGTTRKRSWGGGVRAVHTMKAGGSGRCAPAVQVGGGHDRGGGSYRGIEGRLMHGPDPV
jgi:hypothetical protein